MSSGEHRLALPAGYELGKYRLREVLGSGGFGITYLAEDRMLSRRVAVKELLPNDIATRVDGTTVAAKTKSEEESLTWARERFVNEGRALAACDHPNVVHVYEMVEANGTAYMVTKYEEGRSLERWLKDLGQPPTEEELRGVLLPLLSGLEKVHSAGFLHRDIKPDNIYLTTNGRPVLLDFGSARQAVSNRSMAMTSIVTSGYAPFEQYYEDGNQGPWSDIYAMGAVMYRAIVGKKPPESTRRLKDDPCLKLAAHYGGQYSADFLKAIDKALAVNESKRPQSVAEWRGMLGDELHESATIVRKDHKEEVEGFGLIKVILKTHPWIAPAAGAGVIGIGVLIWQLSKPAPVVVNPGKKPIAVVTASPTAAVTATPAAQPSVTPLAIVKAETPIPRNDDALPSPTAEVSPIGIIPTPGPEIVVLPTPTAIPAVVQAVVDPQLVGSWQTGTTKSKRQHWDVWADGSWVTWGPLNDSGTLITQTGQLKQQSNTFQNLLVSSYEFNGDTLITHNQFGTVEWRRSGASTASNSSSTNNTKRRPSGDTTPARLRPGQEVGRQMLNKFMQGRGFP